MDRKYYVLCQDDCKFEGMTKEQTIAAIAEATGAVPQNIDEAFISQIVNQNGGSLRLWQGTRAEYNALPEKDAGTIYHITDDKTGQEAWNKAAEAEATAQAAEEIAIGAAAQSIATYTHTAGALKGSGANGKFKATVSETISRVKINGESYPVNCAGESEMELVAGAWYTFIFDGAAVNFRGGGAGGLNFKIVGGTTEPTSPAENTIWINTSTAIGEYQFLATEPTTRADGTALQTGDLWLSIGASANVKFNALKKNNLQVYFLMSNQWDGSAWIYKESECFQDGKWQSLSYKVLVGSTFYNGHGLGTMSKAGDYSFTKTTTGYKMYAGDPNTSYCYQQISGEIDITNYKTIKVRVTANATYNVTNQYCQGISLYVYSGSTEIATASLKTATKDKTYDLTIDVSSRTGKVTFTIRANGYGHGTFELIELI